MAYLVDTSVLISLLRQESTPATAYLRDLIDRQIPYGISSMIYLEVLQGSTSQQTFDRLDVYLRQQRFYDPKDVRVSYRDAAHLYFRCRRHGVSPRSVADCLIAAIAIEHDLRILHDDRDYVAMARVLPELKLA